MSGVDISPQASVVPNLADLISARKAERGWTYQQLADRADGAISRQRWQQLGTGIRIKEFPEPATIQSIAHALEVDITLVVLAVAASIGFAVKQRDSALAAMLPPGADRLTDDQRDVVLAVVRALAAKVGATDEDTSTQDTPGDPQIDGKAGTRGTPNTRAGNAGADKPEALIGGDQGSRDDYDLARRTGITEYEWRMANEPQPENENQDTGTNDPA